ncbi:glycoside hydrolase family 43 protein [Aulographum hederae CBS 113979]|uniref:Glycoside hydrolase family 43 protein n=1 Tax=Aulographum hederae CBS 113979 TaxID=1176131 RepID=A0A6G1H4E7_9PEZI|nr:glycoside hydrolase family 43 protein [Aulographum hederae CBS 113979]
MALRLCLLLTLIPTILSFPFRKRAEYEVLRKRSPAIESDFADPSLIEVDDTWYSFATSTQQDDKDINIQLASSDNYDNWQLREGYDALPRLPEWVDQTLPEIWAPDVSQLDDGSFVMYFSAVPSANAGHHCIGAATSRSIDEPFTPLSTPLFCPINLGGAIDASGFHDPNTNQRYIVYKVDGNSLGHGGACNNFIGPIVPTPIVLQAVTQDGITFDESKPALEILQRGPDDGPLVEAPSMMFKQGFYYLFFSSNCYTTPEYDVTWAVSQEIEGPYKKRGPMFSTGIDGLTAPGGASVAADGTHLVFHADSPEGGRSMYVSTVGAGLGLEGQLFATS